MSDNRTLEQINKDDIIECYKSDVGQTSVEIATKLNLDIELVNSVIDEFQESIKLPDKELSKEELLKKNSERLIPVVESILTLINKHAFYPPKFKGDSVRMREKYAKIGLKFTMMELKSISNKGDEDLSKLLETLLYFGFAKSEVIDRQQRFSFYTTKDEQIKNLQDKIDEINLRISHMSTAVNNIEELKKILFE